MWCDCGIGLVHCSGILSGRATLFTRSPSISCLDLTSTLHSPSEKISISPWPTPIIQFPWLAKRISTGASHTYYLINCMINNLVSTAALLINICAQCPQWLQHCSPLTRVEAKYGLVFNHHVVTENKSLRSFMVLEKNGSVEKWKYWEKHWYFSFYLIIWILTVNLRSKKTKTEFCSALGSHH